ncbi:MAG: EamA family transporter [Nitriliruptorales bacterium]|nr:EamA family transporter [Nitriliruptorales bacterium]
MGDARDGRVVAAFLSAALLGGGNAVAVRFSNRELDPLWGATLRFLLATALLLLLVAALRHSLPRGRALAGAVVYGFFQFGLAFGLIYWALVRVHAGLGQVLLALVPLATLFLAVGQRQERLHAQAVIGTLLGLAGVVAVFAGSFEGEVPVVEVLAILVSVVSFAQAQVVIRRFPPLNPTVSNAVGMGTGAVVLLLATLIAGDEMALPTNGETWVALAYVVAIGSVAVFSLNVYVVQQWSASRASYVMVLVPIVTIALSAWLDNEPIRPGLVFGAVFVIGGVWIGALRPTAATAAPTQPPEPSEPELVAIPPCPPGMS